MSPLIFLDFDGVLNNLAHFDGRKARRGTPEWRGMPQESFDPVNVAVLNDLVARSKASIVVSSLWRCGMTVAALRRLLKSIGVVGKVIGKTPELHDCSRGIEIQAWLDDAPQPAPPFVILDDDADMAHLFGRLVQTSFAHGLLPEHCERALELLSEPRPVRRDISHDQLIRDNRNCEGGGIPGGLPPYWWRGR